MSAPSAPQTPVLQTGNGQNLISWNIVTGATSGYLVQRSTDGVTFSALASPVVPYYVDSSVSVGSVYYYQVAATNGTPSAYTASYPPSIVPSLPGQVTLGYLRYQSQLRSDKLNSNYITTDEWNFNINQCAYELYDILVSKFGDSYFLAPPLLVPLNGSLSYTLPDGALYSSAPAFYKLAGVDVNTNGNATGPTAGWCPLPRINFSDRDKYNIIGNLSFPNNWYGQMGYGIFGSQIYIFPQNTSQTLRLFYVPVLTQMLQDTDMLPFSISGWSEYVIVRAALLAMSKEESLEKYGLLERQLAMQIERIETQASNRDIGQPNTVSNTRTTMGDFGFAGWNGGSGGFGYGGW